MATGSPDLRDRVLQTDEEFRQLATKHQELDTRLHHLSHHHYLSAAEQLEQATLKKRKLQLKDRMEDILRRYRNVGAESVVDSSSPAVGSSAVPT